MWFDKSLFAAAGIKQAPASWKEFFADCDKLKAVGIAPIAQGGLYGFELEHTFEDILLSTLGASGYNGLWTGKTSWNGAQVTQALNTFKKYLSYANADYNTVGWDVATQRVIDGAAAMTIMGDWANSMFLAAGKNPRVDYDWAPSPGSTGSFMIVVDGLVLVESAPDRQNAINWLALLGSKKGQDTFSPFKGSIPARLDADRSLYGVYQRQAMTAYAANSLTPSVTHGTAAPASFVKDFANIVATFAATGNVAVAKSALHKAACNAGIGTCP